MLQLQALLIPLVLAFAPATARVQESAVPASAGAQDPDAPWTAWCADFAKALNERDPSAYDRCVDAGAIIDRAQKGVPGRKSFMTGFKEGALTTMSGGQGTFAELTNALEMGGHVDFLRLRGTPGARTALFRIVRAEAGVEYLEFELARGKDEPARAVDVYVASSGERSSDTLRRWLIPTAANDDRGLIDRLIGEEQVLARHWKVVEKLIDAVKSRSVESFAKQLSKLPDELRRDKTILLMRIKMFPPDDPRYVEAIGEVRRYFPDDPCTVLHSIDWFFLQKDYKAALAELSRLDAWAGGDPYLNVLCGNILVAAEDWDGARKVAREAIAAGLGWPDPYWVLITVSLRQQRYDETLSVLIEMDLNFEFNWVDFTTLEEYQGFAASSQHAQWLEHLAEKARAR
ncbi:MAG: hypothetical protein JNL28_01070 [Planctomycetes bacterium]|nr:hypothetical protein [Planctomycetota bacterium]